MSKETIVPQTKIYLMYVMYHSNITKYYNRYTSFISFIPKY